jgi:ABC-type multidrug transport system fused ATPase/permease subunit
MKFARAIDQSRRSWRLMAPVRRALAFVVMGLMIVSAFAETISIASVLPFLAAISNPETVLNHPYAALVLQRFGVDSSSTLVLLATVGFCIAAVAAGAIRLGVIWLEERLSVRIGTDFGSRIYQNILNRPYLHHCNQNSSEIISGLTGKLGALSSFIRAIMCLVRSLLILVVVVGAFSFVDSIVILVAITGIAAIYLLVTAFFRKRIKQVSQEVSRESNRVVRTIQSGLGGIRDIILDSTQETFLHAYDRSNRILRRAQASTAVMGYTPYFFVQSVGIVVIAVAAFHLANGGKSGFESFAVLGMVALAASRLFPVAQDIYRTSIEILSSQNSVEDALVLLEQIPHEDALRPAGSPIMFSKQLELKNVSFSYREDLPHVLHDFSLVVERGSRVGFVGRTGCGKSTLLDIIMGLLPPTTGTIEIDGTPLNLANIKGWYEHIAHVPQAIYLTDDTIASNIAFGVDSDQIDHERVLRAAAAAQLMETIESWPAGPQTIVGENGMRLSGGQRQRVGIARALYKQADVIVLDEATSALDNETEAQVLRGIEKLDSDITIFFVAHRLTTLKNCTSILKFSESGVSTVSYDELIKSS